MNKDVVVVCCDCFCIVFVWVYLYLWGLVVVEFVVDGVCGFCKHYVEVGSCMASMEEASVEFCSVVYEVLVVGILDVICSEEAVDKAFCHTGRV